MSRIYSVDPHHNCDYGIDFINGAGVCPNEKVTALAELTAKGYTVIQGSDSLSPWDKLTKEQIVEFGAYCGVAVIGTKQEIITLIEAALITLAKFEILAFDAIANRSAGTVAAPIFADAAAVKASLPTRIKATLANGMIADVPVASWTDTDTFNKAAAASYTFTAVLGAIPKPYANSLGVVTTVEVVVAA